MPTPTINAIQQFTPQAIKTTHFLAKATTKAAASFALGGKTISVDINPQTPPTAIVNEFRLSPAAAKKLSRRDNLIEGIASAIPTDSNTVREVKTYLARVNVPVNISDNSAFYFISVRRRDAAATANPADALDLNKRITSASEQHFILGLSLNSKKNLVATLVHPNYKIGGKLKKGGATIIVIPRTKPGARPGNVGPLPEVIAQADPDDTQDFAACYQKCMDTVPAWLVAIVATICSACALSFAATPFSIPLTAVACISCAAAVGTVFGNCLLTCHEML